MWRCACLRLVRGLHSAICTLGTTAATKLLYCELQILIRGIYATNEDCVRAKFDKMVVHSASSVLTSNMLKAT